jgi:hypothetical protein
LWQCQPDPDGGYSVRGAYQLLTLQQHVPVAAVDDLVRHKQVPLKMSIFAWRLLCDRLPTKANLVTRGIIDSAAHSCVSGCGGVESAQNLFINCNTFGSLWSLVRSWIDFLSVDPHTISDHFLQFTHSLGGFLARGAPSYSSFGSYVLGSFGTRETIGCLGTQRCLCLRCWKRSKSTPFGG